MFKILSEILFAPQSAKRDGGETPSAEMADPAFAALVKDAEAPGSATTVEATLLAPAVQVVLPQPIIPTRLMGEGEGAKVDSRDVPVVADAPEVDAMTEPPATGNAAESASQPFAMIFGAASDGLPADITAFPPVPPKDAPRDMTTARAPDLAPIDPFATPTAPPAAVAAPPEIAMGTKAAHIAPAPLPQTPTRNEMGIPAEDAAEPPVEQAMRPADSHAARVEPRPIAPNPAPVPMVETTSGTDKGQEKPSKDTAVQRAADLVADHAPASVRVTPPPRDEGKTQFLWRQAMQEEVAPDATSEAPPPPAPAQGLDKRAADGGVKADREGRPTAAPSDVASSPPEMEVKPDRVSVLPPAETPKPDAFPVPGAALGQTPVDRALPGPIQQGTVQHHGAATPVRQVVETLAAQPLDVPGRIELTLTPDTLGKVHFDMRPEGGGLSIVLSAERADTLDLMRRHLPDLMAELKQAGIQAGSFSFSSWNEGQRAQTPPPEMIMEDMSGAAAAAPIPPPRPTRAPGPMGGLDMRF